MNVIVYVFITLAAVYVVLHIGDAFKWYKNILKKLWEKIFKKEE